MRVPWIANPAVWFILNQLRMAFGTFFFLECNYRPEDCVYLLAMLTVIIFFIIGASMVKAMSSCSVAFITRWRSLPIQAETGKHFSLLISIFIIVSIVISALYFYFVGYNMFLLGIYSQITGQDLIQDAATMRLASYSGASYFAPGYVNQFKNTLLPLLVSYLGLRSYLLGRRRGLILSIMLTPIVIILLLGTGQRGAFVLAWVCFIIFLLAVFRHLKWRRLALSIAVVVALFLITSLIIGRGIQEIKDANDLLQLSLEMPSRVFIVNQSEGVVSFRYIYSTETAWGSNWLADVKQMLPGLKDPNFTPLPHLIFEQLYGSTRGTSPLTLAASLWYNFHIIGITLAPLLLGIIYQTVYHRLVRGPKTLFRLATFSALAGVLGLWAAGGIDTLLNKGVAAILLFYILGKWVLGMDLKRRYAEVKA